jgi:chorismate mutase/prephenate dehydrogenase
VKSESLGAGEIERLRETIAEIDRRLLGLARERIQCAREIGRLKLGLDLPVRDFGAERGVFERASRICEELGLPVELGAGVLHALMEESVRVQEELREQSPRTSPGHALVAGGAGGMGGWLCTYLEAQGHAVSVLDPRGAPEGFARASSLGELWGTLDVVALSVPLDAGNELYREILALPPGPLVFDVFSVKTHVLPDIREAAQRGHLVASVHPMFGPSARLLSGRALIVCDAGSKEALRRVRKLFEATSLRIVEIPLEEHDRRMADVLNLAHALNLAFARAIVSSDLDAHAIAEVASTTFKKQAEATLEVVSENPELYFLIQKLNPHGDVALGRLARAVDSLRREIAEDRREDFERGMKEARTLLRRL